MILIMILIIIVRIKPLLYLSSDLFDLPETFLLCSSWFDLLFVILFTIFLNNVDLYVRRSFAGYLWAWLKDSAQLI